VWDGTTTLLALDIVMNQVTPVNCEAPITFGHVKIQLCIDIYNTRISHPYVIILLGMGDIKACLRFPRIHPDLTGAFGFMAGGFYNLATAMVFDLLPPRLVGSHFDGESRLYPWHMLITLIW